MAKLSGINDGKTAVQLTPFLPCRNRRRFRKGGKIFEKDSLPDNDQRKVGGKY